MTAIVTAWILAFAYGGSLGIFSRVLRNYVADENNTTGGGEQI